LSRYTGPVCKICRREGMKLFLKGERCFTDKCAVEQREYPPGQHGQGRVRTTEYRIHLREKQKVRYLRRIRAQSAVLCMLNAKGVTVYSSAAP
jgi:ribosomal protein S4